MKTISSKLYELNTSPKYILIAFIVLGIALHAYNFFIFRSFHLDEAMLAKSFIDRGFIDLLKPLEYDQVAPIGFIYLQEFLTHVFGIKDWVFRLISFTSFLGSIYLIFNLAKLIFNDKLVALISCSLFCLNPVILEYSSEFKQYASDIFVTLLNLYIGIRYIRNNQKQNLALASAVLTISVWFSNIAVISLTVLIVLQCYRFIKLRKNAVLGFAPFVFCFISFSIYYVFFIHGHSAKDTMLAFWSKNNSFLYSNIFSKQFFIDLAMKIKSFLSYTVPFYKFIWMLPLVILYSILKLRKKTELLIILLLPLFTHLTISYLKLYPFHRRLILYLIPMLILLLSFGFGNIIGSLRRRGKIIAYISLFLFLSTYSFKLISISPMLKEEIKVGLNYINNHIEKGDGLYVYYASKPSFYFYKNEYKNLNILETIIYGNGRYADWTQFEKELQNAPNRIWLIFSHLFWKEKNGFTETTYIINFLKKKGYKIAYVNEVKGSVTFHMVNN